MSMYSNFGSDKDYKLDKERKAREKFKPIKNNISIVLSIIMLSSLLGFLSFIFVYWCLSVANIHYALKSLIACVIACSSLLLITPSTDFKKRVREASRPIVFIATLMSLVIGVDKYGAGPLDKYIKRPRSNNLVDTSAVVADTVAVLTSEIGVLKHKGEIWQTVKIYDTGDNVRVRISGRSVRLKDEDADGALLNPGDYDIKITAKGKLVFMGIRNGTSTIEVIP